MTDFLEESAVSTFKFLKNSWGVLVAPYQTYRRLAVSSSPLEVVPLFLVVMLFFLLLSVLRTHSLHPLLLTLDYGALLAGAIVSFVGSVSVLFLTGRLFGGTGHVWGVFVSWGYTLIPTFFWFLMTSFFYVVLPPPRQQTPLGVLFSVVFMSLSMLLFFWKGILYYLTLRFGMRLDFPRIMGVSAILFPLGVLYALSMYKLGIFRVPFI